MSTCDGRTVLSVFGDEVRIKVGLIAYVDRRRWRKRPGPANDLRAQNSYVRQMLDESCSHL